jgi:hypothetical protein
MTRMGGTAAALGRAALFVVRLLAAVVAGVLLLAVLIGYLGAFSYSGAWSMRIVLLCLGVVDGQRPHAPWLFGPVFLIIGVTSAMWVGVPFLLLGGFLGSRFRDDRWVGRMQMITWALGGVSCTALMYALSPLPFPLP